MSKGLSVRWHVPAVPPKRRWFRFLGVGLVIVSLRTIISQIGVGEVITCTEDQPLVTVSPNFLAPAAFAVLKNRAKDHPLTGHSTLAGSSFNHTRGWMVKFNRAGVARFKANPDFEIAGDFFDAVASRESNAFVANLLVSYPPPDGQYAVGPHLDNSVGVWARGPFLAHSVNVMYVDIPDDMVGGELEVWPYESPASKRGKVIVKPAENTLVEFRGDAYHGVKNLQSAGGQPRVSIVLEQYRIDERKHGPTVEFCEGQECREMGV